MNSIQMVNEYTPDYLVTPGEVLEDFLENAGLTQASLADRTGLSKKTINEIIKAKSAITAETALKLERTLGRPAHFWSNLERQYQDDKTRLSDKIKLEKDLHWLDLFPINEMAKLGWIVKCKDKIQQLDVLLRFFALASPQQWEIVWVRELQAAFRKAESSNENAALVSTWLRKGEIEIHKQDCDQFDKQKFKNSLNEIRKLTTEELNTFIPKLKSICAVAGVVLVFVPTLKRLGIYGATRWLNNKYIIQLSLFRKSNDEFWFTIFHEICHILKHSRKELYIEGNGLENEKEDEANIFAQNILIPPEQLKNLLESNYKLTIHQIEQFARDIDIAPGIVVGRLQHDGILPRNCGNELKVKCRYENVQDSYFY